MREGDVRGCVESEGRSCKRGIESEGRSRERVYRK